MHAPLATMILLFLGLSALVIWICRRGKQRLRESQAQLSAIMETAPDAVISIDDAQHIMLFNKGAESIFGYRQDEILGQPLNVLIPPQFHNSHQKLVQDFSTSDASAHYMQDRGEITCQHKSGEAFPAEASISKAQVGSKFIMTVILRDISERKQAESALKESEQRFRIIFETIQDIYYRTDMVGRVTNISPSCLQLTGYSQQELIGTDMATYYANPDQRNTFLEALQKNGAVNDFEIKMVHKDGAHRMVSVTSHIVCDQEGRSVAVEGITRDITVRKRAEDEVARRSLQTRALQEVVERLNRAETLHDVYEVATHGVLNVLGADRSAILLFEADGRTHFKAWAGLPDAYRKALNGHSPWQQHEINAQPICILNVAASDLPSEVKAPVCDAGIHSLAFFPLVGAQALLGKFMAYWNKPFICSDEDVQLGQVLSENLATAIQRIQAQGLLQQSLLDTKQAEAAALNMMEDAQAARVMAEQAEAEMKKLAEASRNIVGLHDITEIYALICDVALEIFDLKLAWLGLIEETSDVITPIAISGISAGFVSGIIVRRDDRPKGCGPSERAVKTGRPQVSEDIEHDSSFQPWLKKAKRHGFRSVLAMPLINVKGKVVGVLHLYSQETGFFSPSRVNMIATFANQAELAIENTRLLDSLEKKVKKRTQQLEIARDQAQVSDRAKSTFLANMSHELRTPLNSILGFSELLSLDKSHPLHPDQLSQLGFILESGTRLLNLINDLLDLSKIESGKMELNAELFDLRELLNHAIKHHAHTLEQREIVVHCDFSADVAVCHGDMQKIHQVLDNLLSNAIKFTPVGGSVRVFVHRVKRDRLKVENKNLYSLPEGDFLKISITDTGIGIAAADQGKLFQPFQQLDGELNRQYEGTGLGLSLCRKIIAMHGGDIWLEHSELRKGSTFTFVIPVGALKS